MGVENRRKSLCSFRRGLLGILVLTPLPRPQDALEVQDARDALEVQDAPLHRDCFLPDAVVEDDVRRASGDGEGGR